MVAAYDTELFGHWWHEGPWWLEEVLCALPAAGVRVTTLRGALAAALTLAIEPVPLDALGPADEASVTMSRYFAELVARRRHGGDDLVSAVVRACDDDGGQLGEEEIVSNLLLLMVAGFETTTNLLGNGLRLLLDRPVLAARLRDNPKLAPGFVEEILRFDSPVQQTTRWSPSDVEVDGVRLPAGKELTLVLGAANRDARRFPDRTGSIRTGRTTGR